jgi:hypothetical protein
VYRITAEEDRQYIEEFRRKPIGPHSPGLQRLLNVMRLYRGGFQYVLVCRVPFSEYSIGKMFPNRTAPIEIEEAATYSTREEAEWELFCRRWTEHTGEQISTSYRD